MWNNNMAGVRKKNFCSFRFGDDSLDVVATPKRREYTPRSRCPLNMWVDKRGQFNAGYVQ